MKVTRYPQSCLLLEKDGHKIVIDPGVHFLRLHNIEELKGVEAALLTHRHADHYDASITQTLQAQGAAIYANADTAKLVGEGCTVVNDGDALTIAGFAVEPRELPHCPMVNGKPGPQNTGYIIDGAFFHPGDGKELAGLHVNAMALPIAGPSISPEDAYNFAVQLGVKIAIPVHYDVFVADPNVIARAFADNGAPFELRVLADGESTEI
ncbi:MAG TPA: MBL fold metallo-hydrolase [Candidatus Saccharimonas sp.]|nr:MBL fold metallo-hydrolase [Candidatus Saccharimonas sp.]